MQRAWVGGWGGEGSQRAYPVRCRCGACAEHVHMGTHMDMGEWGVGWGAGVACNSSCSREICCAPPASSAPLSRRRPACA